MLTQKEFLTLYIFHSVLTILTMNHTSSRPIWEGGQYDGDESQRQNALRLAVELGADYVDVELKVAISSMF